MDAFRHRIQQTYARRATHFTRFGSGVDVYVGLEERTVPSAYQWDGLKRGGEARHAHVVFQYSLDGWGCYADETGETRVLPGRAFSAVVPSPHRYFLPEASDRWLFFFLIIHHPYIVERMIERHKTCRPVFTIPPESMLAARVAMLFERVCQGAFPDSFALEQSQFEFLVEYERFAHHLQHPQAESQRMLDRVRRQVLANLDQPLGVEELATLWEMSRSHFSHHFRNVTGLAPAQYVVRLRLQEASHRLTASRDKLETIARQTGFADANHFCKVFRKHYHVSPGEFRRQFEAQLSAKPVRTSDDEWKDICR
jgi:AraC-like DNA-binding protein